MKESNNSKVSKKHVYIFNIIIIWTIITSIFTWLPLVRIIGRPKEYYWGVMSFQGEGTDGPYWIFILATTFVIFMLYSARSKDWMKIFESPKDRAILMA